jgi:SAM-dependent methyltransferase
MTLETIYDYPLYYDILFNWDRSKEADFYHHIFERCGVHVGERVLEVACGTGRVASRLAQRGWQVTGLDISPAMLAFLKERGVAEGFGVETLCADMTTFSTAVKFAAAYNPMSSFRLLQTDTEVEMHLRKIATALQPGGVYVLDLTFLSSDDEPPITTDESWEMMRGRVSVRATNDAVYVNDDGVEQCFAWGQEAHLRGYTAIAFAERVDTVVELKIESWHPESTRATGVSEFSIDDPVMAPVVGRAMVVLRRR